MVKAENIALAIGGLVGLGLIIYFVKAKPPEGAEIISARVER